MTPKRKERHLQALPMEGVPELPPPKVQAPLAIASYDLFGFPGNEAEWSRWGKAMVLLEEAKVTAEELPALAMAYRSKFPNAAWTLMAIATRPGELRNWLIKRPLSGDALNEELEWRRQAMEGEGDER